jgi:hypothetical protein
MDTIAMRIYEFTISIDHPIEDMSVVDAFYGKTPDASIAGSGGKTFIHFDRESNSLDEALRSAMADLLAEGWQACEIMVAPGCLAPSLTA